MRTAFYIVLETQQRWWIDLEGRSTGPFPTVEVAITSAITMAEATAKAGGRSEVRVAGPNYNNRVVYRSVAQSALTRAVRSTALETA